MRSCDWCQEALQEDRWQEGLEEGHKEEKLEIAQNLLPKLSDLEIADATGLTVEVIASLRAEAGVQGAAD